MSKKLTAKDRRNIARSVNKHHLDKDDVRALRSYLKNPTSAAYYRLDGYLMAAINDFEQYGLENARCMASIKSGGRCSRTQRISGFCLQHA